MHLESTANIGKKKKTLLRFSNLLITTVTLPDNFCPFKNMDTITAKKIKATYC